MRRWHELFVPGRVCLFGEHSDWAGSYRRINSKLQPGQVIIAGTNQGLYARVRAHHDKLIVRSILPGSDEPQSIELPMDRHELLQTAEAGGFFSYAAGVAYHMLTFYRVQGIEIDNYQTTLPVRKGLSSSAAFSVLLARAYNRVYDLKLTIRAEMEAAYQGEIRTPSRCGRMDQGCAFGQVPVKMTFNGELLHTHRLTIGAPLHMLVADLNGKKDTIKILGDLNRAFPFADDDESMRVQQYLGPINTELVERASTHIAEGDAEALGKLMTEAQRLFDDYLMPACPEELTSPKLHRVLNDPRIQGLTWGGKGVGSQGDGCVQFVTRSVSDRQELVDYLANTYGMKAFELDLTPPQAVRKAVIPVAGYGTRMFPASKALKKELFPVITPDGMAKPIILAVVEEAVQAGIEEIALIVRSGDEQFYDDFFNQPVARDHYSHLSESHQKYCQYLHNLGERLTFIPQQEQAGFGHAVYCARDFIGKDPFLLMLGDHLYVSQSEVPCARQLIDAYEQCGARRSVVGCYVADVEEISNYGTLAGEALNSDQRLLEVREFAEKPNRDYARRNLVTPDLPPDKFLCIYGQYILSPAIFECLGRQIDADAREAGEYQLTTALETLRKQEGVLGYRVAGRHYDTGLPGPYVQTLHAIYHGE